MKRLVDMAEDVRNPYPGKFGLCSRLADAVLGSTRSLDTSPVTERTFWALRNAMPIDLGGSEARSFIDLFYAVPWHLQAPELPILTAFIRKRGLRALRHQQNLRGIFWKC